MKHLKYRFKFDMLILIFNLGRIWIRFVLNSVEFVFDRVIRVRIQANFELEFGFVLKERISIMTKFRIWPNSEIRFSEFRQNEINPKIIYICLTWLALKKLITKQAYLG